MSNLATGPGRPLMAWAPAAAAACAHAACVECGMRLLVGLAAAGWLMYVQ
jgi:hypothetical protein